MVNADITKGCKTVKIAQSILEIRMIIYFNLCLFWSLTSGRNVIFGTLARCALGYYKLSISRHPILHYFMIHAMNVPVLFRRCDFPLFEENVNVIKCNYGTRMRLAPGCFDVLASFTSGEESTRIFCASTTSGMLWLHFRDCLHFMSNPGLGFFQY